jgi:hypothetical protein
VQRAAALAACRLQPLPVGVGQPGRIEQEHRGGDVLSAGQQRANLIEVAVSRGVDHTVGVQPDDLIDVRGGGDADRVPADQRPCVNAVLGVGIHPDANHFEVAAVVENRRQQLAADRADSPQDHPVFLVGHGGDHIRGARHR